MRAVTVIPSLSLSSDDVSPLKCTGATVRRLARRITSFYEHHMQRTGFTLPQYSLLKHLDTEPQSLIALARRMELDRTTLTRNLKLLQSARLVEERTSQDARERRFVLTAAGKRARREAQASWKSAQQALERELGAREVRELHQRLDAALAKLKTVLPEEN